MAGKSKDEAMGDYITKVKQLLEAAAWVDHKFLNKDNIISFLLPLLAYVADLFML